jgi:ribosome-binding protein aMBF1 (putative translation factor)
MTAPRTDERPGAVRLVPTDGPAAAARTAGPSRRGADDRPTLREALGDVLQDLRHRAGRTQRQVAARSRVSLPYLSEIERGRKEASSEVLSALCDALEVSLPDVLDLTARRLSVVSAPVPVGSDQPAGGGAAQLRAA